MTGVALVLWTIILWLLLGIAAIAVTAVWLFIVYAVIRLAAEFIKAYKDADDLEEEDLY